MAAIELWYSVVERVRDADFESFRALLDRDEAERAVRFRFEADRRAYVLAHGLLRLALSRRFSGPPTGWRLVYDDRGRPDLPDPDTVKFSISHTRGLSICAIVEPSFALGCDAESLASRVELHRDASPFLSKEETVDIRSLPENERNAAALSLWTLKESYLKAIGTGLARSPTELSISVTASDWPLLSECAICGAPCGKWRLARLVLGEPFAVSLAVHGVEPGGISLQSYEATAPDAVTGPVICRASAAGVFGLDGNGG